MTFAARVGAAPRLAASVPGPAGGALDGSAEAVARRVLAEWAPLLGFDPSLADLFVKCERRGIARRVVVFEQRIDGVPVLGGDIGVTLVGGEPALLYSGYRPAVDGALDAGGGAAAARRVDRSGGARLDAAAAVARAREAIARGAPGARDPKAASGWAGATRAGTSAAALRAIGEPLANDVWYDAGGSLRRGVLVRMAAEEPIGDWRVLVDAATGEVASVEDDARYAHAFDDATGRVFSPNPVVTLQDMTLADMDDADQSVFDAAYKTVLLRDVTLRSGLYRLEGPHVRIGDFESPSIAPPGVTDTPSFEYTRADDGFEAAMAYYHIDRAQRYLQSLCFQEVARFAIEVDAHGVSGADNSHYLPSQKRLAFGDGCVDDAEDADVLYHEYGHAIQDNQVPGWGTSVTALSLGEGFGDYWAASLSSHEGPYSDSAQVFDWDRGPNPAAPCWAGRRVDSELTMADFIGAGGANIYRNGLIWSASLWDIRSAIGASFADRLVIEAHFGLPTNTTYEQNATSIAIADAALYGGAHVPEIVAAFAARGIVVDLPAVAARPSGEGPDVTVGVLQNPVLTAHLDVVVVASEPLGGGSPTGFADTTALVFTQQDCAAQLFRADHRLAAPGVLAIEVAATDLAGNTTVVTRDYAAAKAIPDAPTLAASADGRLTIEIGAGALPAGTWLVIGRVEAGDASWAGGASAGSAESAGDAYTIGPVGLRLAEPAVVTLAMPGAAGAGGLALVRVESGEALPTRRDPQTGALAAALDVLGTIAARPSAPPASPIDAATVRLGPAAPNPSSGPVRFAYRVDVPQRVEVAVYTVAGERVRELLSGRVASGEATLSWDGRDARGRRVASGVYILRVTGERAVSSRKLSVVR